MLLSEMNTPKILCLAFVLLITNSALAFQTTEVSADETLLIFVRHTEKADDGTRNPPLNPKGLKRANSLANELAEMPLSAIYSTNYKRTLMTATPVAYHFELPIYTYDFSNLEEFLNKVIAEHKGKAVLIVGHSNTTPNLINLVMQEDRIAQIDEKQYGDLFLLYSKAFGDTRLSIEDF
jgi:2,3-bisphosphoglycerate-dependent phosphoglycerate mutase